MKKVEWVMEVHLKGVLGVCRIWERFFFFFLLYNE